MEPDGVNIKNCKLQIGHINEETGEIEYTTLSEYGNPVPVDLVTDSVDIENRPTSSETLTYTFSSPLKGTGVNKIAHLFGVGKDRSRRSKAWWRLYKDYKKHYSARVAKHYAWALLRKYRTLKFNWYEVES